MADINIHSRSDRDKTDFNNFIEYQTTDTIHQLPKPTRPMSNTSPDIVITSTNIGTRCTIDILDLIGSDHAPIKLTLHCQCPPFVTQNIPAREILRFDKADWEGYRTYITT